MKRPKRKSLIDMWDKYGPPRDSEAWESYRRVEPDRSKQLMNLLSDSTVDRHRKEVRRQILAHRLNPSIFETTISVIVVSIIETLLERFSSYLVRDPRMILFRYTKESTIVANQSSFSDDSSLVLLSDGLASLCIYLAQINTLWTRWCQAARNGVEQINYDSIDGFQGTATSDASIMSVRYWLLQQRIFGLGGQLGIDLATDEAKQATRLAQAASTFILAHEAAHYVLGHEHKSGALAEGLPVTDDSLTCEAEADQLGIQVTSLALRDWFGEDASPIMALAGAKIVLSAISVTERGLFVRRARTHPSVKERVDSILGPAPSKFREPALIYCHGASIAAAYGEEWARPLGLDTWERGSSDPGIHRDYPSMDYRRSIAKLDQVHGMSAGRLEDAMKNRLTLSAGADLTDTPELIQKGGLPLLLRTWGVPEFEASYILNEGTPLSFQALLRVLAGSARLASIDSDEMRRYTATASALFIQRSFFRISDAHS